MARASSYTTAEPALTQFLLRQRLATPDEPALWTPLAGGVSSDIWRVDLPGRSLCVKRALAQLRVASEWLAPVSRNRYEWEWLLLAAKIAPQAVPQPLAHDPELGLFAMAFLPPERYPLWKAQLLAGHVDVTTATKVGELLATLHNATAGRPDLAAAFDSGENFRALRLDPYLLATGLRHPDLAPALAALAERTAAARIALVHGDVSPKNILVGPDGPVLLDAECAWYGDPAFDIAFCLNHLLLKSVLMPQHSSALLRSFDALAMAYLAEVRFEPRAQLEARAASLLPALALARIDGKSPVEYLIGREALRDLVRAFGRELVRSPGATLAAVSACWRSALAQAQPSTRAQTGLRAGH
jgi:aminoglycoside phosphotransferase (APT) family kinase protein